MNKNQKAIIICGIVAIIIIFISFQDALQQNGNLQAQQIKLSIDIRILSIQYVTVFIVGGLLWLLVKDTKSKDNLKGDQEKTK